MTLVYSKRAVDLANPFLTKNCFYLLIKLGWLDYTCYITCETLIQQKDDSKSLHILDLRLFDIQTSCHQSYPVKLFILETIWWLCWLCCVGRADAVRAHVGRPACKSL